MELAEWSQRRTACGAKGGDLEDVREAGSRGMGRGGEWWTAGEWQLDKGPGHVRSWGATSGSWGEA